MTRPVFEITKAAGFDAAHFLDIGPKESPYRRMHGHSFLVEATLRGEQKETVGWVEDLGALDSALKTAAAELDHGVLNERPGLENPTLEHLCLHFVRRLQPEFPNLTRITVSRPTIKERCTLNL